MQNFLFPKPKRHYVQMLNCIHFFGINKILTKVITLCGNTSKIKDRFADVSSYLTFKLSSSNRGYIISFKLKCHRLNRPNFGELFQNSAWKNKTWNTSAACKILRAFEFFFIYLLCGHVSPPSDKMSMNEYSNEYITRGFYMQ